MQPWNRLTVMGPSSSAPAAGPTTAPQLDTPGPEHGPNRG
jgi:hypothetical protein